MIKLIRTPLVKEAIDLILEKVRGPHISLYMHNLASHPDVQRPSHIIGKDTAMENSPLRGSKWMSVGPPWWQRSSLRLKCSWPTSPDMGDRKIKPLTCSTEYWSNYGSPPVLKVIIHAQCFFGFNIKSVYIFPTFFHSEVFSIINFNYNLFCYYY